MLENPFGKLITAMITPFDNEGALNIKESLRVASHLVDHGTDTVLLAGTTGESPTLTHDEEYLLFEKVTKAIKGKGKVMAGTGSNCTKTAIETSMKAESLGVDSLLQVVPYYNKPTQEGLYQHFKAIAESVSLPILLYNIPGRTSRNMEPETIARLSKIDNIVGIKEAAGDLDQVSAIKQLVADDFLIYSGDDALTLPILERGGTGVVSVASHCVGPQIKALIEDYNAGDTDKAQRIHEQLMPIFEALFITTNPVPVKVAMNLLGFEVGSVRLPLVPATTDEITTIKAALETMLVID